MDKQQSSHIEETTSCSGKRNKCYNTNTHKRAKSNCINSYSGVSSSGSNMNNSGNVKTVVFGPGALNNKEQVINVAYKFDSRKQHMMSQDNNNNNSCLKIFINFMDINKDSNNKSVNKSTNSNNVDKKKSVSKPKKNKCNNNHKEIKVKYCDINISADNMEKSIDKQIMLMSDKKSKNFNNNHNNTNNNIHNNHETNTITYNNFTLPSNTHEEILETSELINKYIRDCMESEVKSNQGELSLDDVKDIIKCFSFKNIRRTKSKTIFTEEINNTYYNGVYKQYNNYFF